MGGAKQDEAPVSHIAASPHCCKENTWRDHHCRVHFAVAEKATARQLNGPCDSLAISQKNEKMRTKIYGCQHFEMPNVLQAPFFGSHLVVIWHLFGISKC